MRMETGTMRVVETNENLCIERYAFSFYISQPDAWNVLYLHHPDSCLDISNPALVS